MTQTDGGEPEYAGRRLSEWLGHLAAPDAKVRRWAASTLDGYALDCQSDGEPVPAPVVSALADALGDPDAGVRGEAALALGDIGEAARRAIPRLMELLADDREEAGTRAAAAKAVGDLGGARESAPVLLRLIRRGAEEVREAAAAALAEADLSGLGIEGELRDRLSDESLAVRAWICWSLWRLTGQAGGLVPLLVEALRDDRSRLDAARLLCRMKDQAVDALPHLLALRDDPNWAVRLQAGRTTLHIPCGDELALPVLEALRDAPDEVVRMYVAEALKKRGRA